MKPTWCTVNVADGKLVRQSEPCMYAARDELSFDPHEQSVFGVFDVKSVEKFALASAKAMMRKLDPNGGAPVALINLRTDLGRDAEPIVLCGDRVARLPDSGSVVIATFRLQPTVDAQSAQRLQSRSASSKSNLLFGMTDTTTFGKSETTVVYKSEVADPARARNYSLLGQFFALPRLLLSRAEFRMPVLTRLLVDAKKVTAEKRGRAAAAKAAAALGRQRLASARTLNEGADDNDESDAGEDDVALRFLHSLHAQNHADWLSAVVSTGAFTVQCDLLGPLSKQQILAKGRSVRARFEPADVLPDERTWQRAIADAGDDVAPPATWPYLVYDSAFSLPPEPVPLPMVVPHAPQNDRPDEVAECRPDEVAEHQPAAVVEVERPLPCAPIRASAAVDHAPVAAVVAQTNASASAAPTIVVARAYEPLRHFARHVQLTELTIYEVETYARARLHWHVARLSRQERAVCGDDDEWYERGAKPNLVSRYPQSSGARRVLLHMIGADAVEREGHHEAIGLGVLALVAASQPALRDNLLYLEALAIEAQSCADREAIDVDVATHLELLERFWEMCGPISYSVASDNTLERVMASIADDWQSGLVVGT